MASTTQAGERGNLSESIREPPELSETLKVLEMKDLPPKTTPWKDIEKKFLPVDFLLLTAKDCEHLSCFSFLDDIKMGYDRNLGPVNFGFNSSKLKIAVIRCFMGSSGPGGSTVVVKEAVPILRPKAVICVGYCASMDEKKAKLGDVIVSAKLITCASNRVGENGIEEHGEIVPPQQRMAKLIKLAGAGWIAPLKNPEDLKVTVRNDGVLLSGPTVLDNPELKRELKNRFRQATAIEMEGEGLYAAAHNHEIEWLVVKGVSDFGDGSKSATDSWRPFASVMAASLVAHMLNDSIAFEKWRHYEDNSDVEDDSPQRRRRSSSSSDPERKKPTAGESYAEDAQPGPSNQGEPASIRPGDKAPTTYKDNSDVEDGSPPQSSGSDPERNKAIAGNLSMREPPKLKKTLRVLEMEDLPPTTTPWKDIKEKFLPVDFLLLTAEECELISCLSFLKDIERGYEDKLGHAYFGFNSSKLKIAVIRCSKGAAASSGAIVVVQGAVPILRPKAVICVGYCASLDEKKAKLGDVIVSAKLITYALVKVRKDGIEERGHVVPPQQRMAKLINDVGAGWKAPLKKPKDLKVTVRSDGELLSGPTVLDNPELRRKLKKRFPRGTAIEMEGEGLYAAAHNHGIEWLVIKGVSDFGDGSISATSPWRPFASVMAASLVAHMLNDSNVFEKWPHYENKSNRKRRSSTPDYTKAKVTRA